MPLFISVWNFGWNKNCNLWYAVDVFYQVNVILVPLIDFLNYSLLSQQYVLLMTAIYYSLCVVDENLCKLNN